MKRKRFTEERPVGIVRGRKGARRGGPGLETRNLGGLGRQRLTALENENGKLKLLLADAMLDNAARRGCCQKMYDPPRKVLPSDGLR